MSENLISRVKRLISGAVYDGIDAVEASMPETALRESIREIDRTIDEVREEMSKVQRERHVAAKRVKLSEEKIDGLADRIATALDSDREDLAQACVERQLDLEAQIPVLEKTQEDASERIAELSGMVEALRGRMAEMEEELRAFQMAKSAAAGDLAGIDGAGPDEKRQRRTEKAEAAFDRVMKNATGVDSMGRSDRETISKLVELETLERQQKVAKRLDAFRKKERKAG